MKVIKKYYKYILMSLSIIIFIMSFFINNKIIKFISLIPIIINLIINVEKLNLIAIVIALLNINNYIDSYVFILIYNLVIGLFNKFNKYSKDINIDFDKDMVVNVKKNKKTITKKISDIKINDTLIINKDEYIYFDCKVVNGTSKIYDLNKNKTVKINKNTNIQAGAKNLDKEITVKVTSSYKDTLFYKRNNYLNNLINRESEFQNNFKLIINIISVILLANYLILYLFTKNIYVLPLYFILLINLFSKVINILIKNTFIKLFKDNIYFKNKDIFFNLRKVKNIFFDKSGVITTGEYRITKVKASNEDEFYKYLLIGENSVNNKISEVIKEHKKIDVNGYLDKVKNYKYINGRGISYKYDKCNILIGNEYFLKEHNIEIERIDDVGTIIYIVKDKEMIGYLVISDGIKKSVKKNLLKLEEFGLIRKFLFSGDNTRLVSVIAKEVGILDYYSNANIYEKGFWYLYNSKKYKGKNVYVRNSEFDSEHLNVDINIDFNNKEIEFNNSDILVDNDIYSLVKLFKYIKDFMGDFIKNILLLIIFTLINILLICFGINYLSIIFSVNILIFVIIYYNNYIK